LGPTLTFLKEGGEEKKKSRRAAGPTNPKTREIWEGKGGQIQTKSKKRASPPKNTFCGQ